MPKHAHSQILAQFHCQYLSNLQTLRNSSTPRPSSLSPLFTTCFGSGRGSSGTEAGCVSMMLGGQHFTSSQGQAGLGPFCYMSCWRSNQCAFFPVPRPCHYISLSCFFSLSSLSKVEWSFAALRDPPSSAGLRQLTHRVTK